MAAGYIDYAHSITGKILDFFEEYCGVKYPLSKLGKSQSFLTGYISTWSLQKIIEFSVDVLAKIKVKKQK